MSWMDRDEFLFTGDEMTAVATSQAVNRLVADAVISRAMATHYTSSHDYAGDCAVVNREQCTA